MALDCLLSVLILCPSLPICAVVSFLSAPSLLCNRMSYASLEPDCVTSSFPAVVARHTASSNAHCADSLSK